MSTTTAGEPVLPTPREVLQKILYELLNILHTSGGIPYQLERARTLIDELLVIYQNTVSEFVVVEVPAEESDAFEEEWSCMVWSINAVLSRFHPITESDHKMVKRLHEIIFILVDKVVRCPLRPPRGIGNKELLWIHFSKLMKNTLRDLHTLYLGLENPSPNYENAVIVFGRRELHSCLEAYRTLCIEASTVIKASLRNAQIDRMSSFSPIPDELLATATAFYSNIMFTMGLLAGRLQVFRNETNQSPSFRSDPVRPLVEKVFAVTDQLISDCLFSQEPSTSPILVTNNLFEFDVECLALPYTIRQYDVQIVCEETAAMIQEEMRHTREGAKSAFQPIAFASAALLAMKPKHGHKRHNATANIVEGAGGNTAHKKSDVNSKEVMTIEPCFSESLRWTGPYPHLLCTTRQKDAILLDTKLGQNTGQRPVFYFYIQATAYSATGYLTYMRTLSLPFTIATRRNQDCQVQRMNSSYTATCFWLFGNRILDGLVLKWNDMFIDWPMFQRLFREYFKTNTGITRPLEDDDFLIFEQKMSCPDCTEIVGQHQQTLISFKNVMCAHLRCEVDNQLVNRFSLWRGIIEIIQMFEDQRNFVKLLWDDYLLHGFKDVDTVINMLSNHVSVMCCRFSFLVSGSILVTCRTPSGNIIHLEAIEYKNLQAKNAMESIADIAKSSGIVYILDARGDLQLVDDVIKKYRIGAVCPSPKQIFSNVAYLGDPSNMQAIFVAPLKIAVVTCDQSRYNPAVPPISLNANQRASSSPENQLTDEPEVQEPRELGHDEPEMYGGSMNGSGYGMGYGMEPQVLLSNGSTDEFATQLDFLMRTHGKSAEDVLNLLTFGRNNMFDYIHY